MWECIGLATEGRGYEKSLFVSASFKGFGLKIMSVISSSAVDHGLGLCTLSDLAKPENVGVTRPRL